jgi:hypothetical protein
MQIIYVWIEELKKIHAYIQIHCCSTEEELQARGCAGLNVQWRHATRFIS